MTGGQHIDGELTVPEMAAQVAAEGVKKLVIVSDEPEKHSAISFPAVRASNIAAISTRSKTAARRRRRDGDDLRQTCAAEKRRRRKRGLMEDPPKRAFINELVCEGCGDCSRASNCVSVEPLETEFGRKRKINQSVLQQGFFLHRRLLPELRDRAGRGAPRRAPRTALRTRRSIFLSRLCPKSTKSAVQYRDRRHWRNRRYLDRCDSWHRAHMEGKSAATLDMMGLAQKGGAVRASYVCRRESAHPRSARADRTG